MSGETDPGSGAAEGALSAEDSRTMGAFFLVEQADTVESDITLKWMTTAPPGGLCFWNPSHKSGAQLRPIVRAYSEAAQNAGSPPVLFSTDYEGGGITLSPSGNHVAGVQRYTSDMTLLAHPRWIGTIDRKDDALGRELAHLHGYISARELKSIGINYPLGTISDLADNLFATRGLDTNPDRVATLMGELIDGALSVPNEMYVTKHFPGLGLTKGDTHEEVVTAPMYTDEQAQEVLEPFLSAINTSIRVMADPRLSVLAGHAVFPYWDPDFTTTTSEKLLTGVLRTDLAFTGVTVSDAMWMAPYDSLSSAQLLRVYVQSFLAGIDMLMIPHVKYASAVSYFRKVGAGTLSTDEQAALTQVIGLSWPDLQTKFAARMVEARGRMDAARNAVGYAHETMDPDGTVPSSTTTTEHTRYDAILKQFSSAMP